VNVPKHTHGKARMREIRDAVCSGGCVRHEWATGKIEVVYASGVALPLDGRSYQAFCYGLGLHIRLTETGSTDTKDLIQEWRMYVA